jgi:hypothetical protein
MLAETGTSQAKAIHQAPQALTSLAPPLFRSRWVLEIDKRRRTHMKLKVIQGEKGKNQNKNQKPESEKRPLEDYYEKERPRAQEMEQAEGDEDIVDAALKNQERKGNAA